MRKIIKKIEKSTQTIELIKPIPGAEKTEVPKYFIGILFWIDGLPGNIVIVNVAPPRKIGNVTISQGIFTFLNN
ncbi:hypothetical protein E3410_002545 [Enterococcus faecalis]|nr:hypothetical protein [Enterococcus faecalis]EKL7634370.1 hypothetical protein [Enterococcus faecalis]HCT4296624.1 hypothetical protein [Enterococcus faecalis]